MARWSPPMSGRLGTLSLTGSWIRPFRFREVIPCFLGSNCGNRGTFLARSSRCGGGPGNVSSS